MEYVRLGDYCEITSSKRVFAEQYTSIGVPFYRSREIIERREHKEVSEPLYISESLYNKFKEKFGVPANGDILLTSVGTLGIPYLVGDETFYFKDGNLTWMKNFSDKLDSRYLFYWLNSCFGKSLLLANATGSSQSALTIDILKKYKIFVPEIDQQKKIITILSAYDDLIENNNKRIKILEKMAENLYKEWFVRFRFPGHEQVEFEKGIPKGWKVVKLEKMVEFNPTIRAIRNRDFKIIPMAALSTSSMLIDTNLFEISKKIEGSRSSNGDTLLARITPCLENGKTGYVRGLNHDEVAGGSTEFIVMRAKGISSFLVYFIARDPVFRGYAIGSMNGADGRQRVKADKLKKIQWIKPSRDINALFDEKCRDIFDMVYELYLENQNLTKQRDLLLPRLMSGKLEV